MSTEKRGGPEAVARCEEALAQIRRTKALLEERFSEVRDEPDGWRPIDAVDLLVQAMGMLESLPSVNPGDGRRPTREERRAAYRIVRGAEPPPGWPPASRPRLRVLTSKDAEP